MSVVISNVFHAHDAFFVWIYRNTKVATFNWEEEDPPTEHNGRNALTLSSFVRNTTNDTDFTKLSVHAVSKADIDHHNSNTKYKSKAALFTTLAIE